MKRPLKQTMLATWAVLAVAACLALAADDTPLDIASNDTDKKIETNGLSKAMNRLAKDVRDKIGSGKAIRVGEYTSNGGLVGSAAIQLALRTALESLPESKDPNVKAFTVSDDATLALSGSFRVGRHTQSNTPCLIIESNLIDSASPNGVDSQISTYLLTDDLTLRTMLGITDNPPLAAAENAPGNNAAIQLAASRNTELLDKFFNPTFTAANDGSLAKASPADLFGMEILGADGRPLPIVDEKGQAVVKIPPETQYSIRLTNASGRPCGVTLTVDGINTLAFSQYSNVGKWVMMGQKPTMTIPGWLRNDGTAASFLLTEYTNSVAADLGISGPDVGAITAVFCAAAPEGQPLPADEPEESALAGVARGDQATGAGPIVSIDTKEQRMTFGVTRSSITIRYDRNPDQNLPPAN